jgi:large subunit ribosomal protein L10
MVEKKIQQYKIDAVGQLERQFSEVQSYFLTDYRGLSVDQITDIRGKLRALDAEIHVVKNNFAKRAFELIDVKGLEDYLVGPTAIALVKGEPGPVAKALFDAVKSTPLEVKAGYVSGEVMNAEATRVFSTLPTRDEAIQMLMYAMNGVTSKLVRTIQAVAEQKASAEA